MRVPLKWLSDYVALTRPVNEIAHLLTMAGLEVTAVERTGGDWEGVVVGHVREVRPHPNADRLRLVTVDIGSARPEVVCGASNVAAGQKVAYAGLGAELVDARSGGKSKLKKANIRGVVSEGMVCSERELGMGDEHEGILVLADDAQTGRPLGDVLGETILVIDMKPNRADGLSVLGVAREVAALTGATWQDPRLDFVAGDDIDGRARAEIADADLCPRFTLALVEGIEIVSSPSWMQERLRAAGMRPINNVVDITNYVMLELGQPIHAFDYDKVRDHHIIVRRARPGEKLTTLDGKERIFTGEQLLITDPGGPVAVAGVMGGLDTEVTESTSNILLEVANFNSVNIRRTATALKLPSEASRRFAWGISPELAPFASRRATKLLVELASGRAASGLVDVYPSKWQAPRVPLAWKRVPQVLGIDPPRDQIVSSLQSLGFSVDASEDILSVRPPYWRLDIERPDDVVEEVARLVGYDQIPARPIEGRVPPRVFQPVRELRESVRDTLVGAGMQEVITYPLTSLEALKRVVSPETLEASPPLSVVNPLNVGQEYLRTTLRAALLEAVARSLRVSRGRLALFECARVYEPRTKGLPEEREHAAGAVTGARLDRWGTPTEKTVDFFDAKAYVDALFQRLGVSVVYREAERYGFLPGRTASVLAPDGEELGVLGQVHPRTAASFDVGEDVYLFEVQIDAISQRVTSVTQYRAFSRYPAVVEDLAVVVGHDRSASDVLFEVEQHPLVARARLFDQYEGKQVPEGKKSLAISIMYQAPDRTLTDKDVARARERILSRLQARFGAELRG
ncbi:MAG TPA: phenylalanine--tRNA ligase subunit beta [Vicinamibacteria bacterium]|nr:phenylalanine--tRNA ligase subunit beta [Vicinamibacteria bacterium]